MDVVGDAARAPRLASAPAQRLRLSAAGHPAAGLAAGAGRQRGLLDPAAVAPLREIRDHNALLFDFVLKRSLAQQRRRASRDGVRDPAVLRRHRLTATDPCTSPTSSTSCAQRRFAPFFWTQFLGAGNDNVYKNALVILVAYHAAAHCDARRQHAGQPGGRRVHPAVLAVLGHGGPARRQVREVAPHPLHQGASRSRSWSIGALGFWRQNLPLLFAALLLMGVHSTLFGPVKYAILPQHLKTRGTGRRQRPGRDGNVRRDPARHDRRRPARGDRAGTARCSPAPPRSPSPSRAGS